MDPRFCEYEVKKLRSPVCSRQENAIFLPHIQYIHGTWGPPFRTSLYVCRVRLPFCGHDHTSLLYDNFNQSTGSNYSVIEIELRRASQDSTEWRTDHPVFVICECCWQSQAEVVTWSGNNIHESWGSHFGAGVECVSGQVMDKYWTNI